MPEVLQAGPARRNDALKLLVGEACLTYRDRGRRFVELLRQRKANGAVRLAAEHVAEVARQRQLHGALVLVARGQFCAVRGADIEVGCVDVGLLYHVLQPVPATPAVEVRGPVRRASRELVSRGVIEGGVGVLQRVHVVAAVVDARSVRVSKVGAAVGLSPLGVLDPQHEGVLPIHDAHEAGREARRSPRQEAMVDPAVVAEERYLCQTCLAGGADSNGEVLRPRGSHQVLPAAVPVGHGKLVDPGALGHVAEVVLIERPRRIGHELAHGLVEGGPGHHHGAFAHRSAQLGRIAGIGVEGGNERQAVADVLEELRSVVAVQPAPAVLPEREEVVPPQGARVRPKAGDAEGHARQVTAFHPLIVGEAAIVPYQLGAFLKVVGGREEHRVQVDPTDAAGVAVLDPRNGAEDFARGLPALGMQKRQFLFGEGLPGVGEDQEREP